VNEPREDYQTRPADSPYHRGLPIGERLSAEPLLGSPFFGFDGDLTVKPLEPMLVPEAPRSGELDPGECFHCGPAIEHAIWRDDLWHVGSPTTLTLPFVAGLAPNAHVRLDEMSGELLTSFGEMVQRLAGAVQALEEVARTHFSRWGDGSAHFHMHFLARPLGMMQGRGPMLAFWDDLLPPVDPELVETNRRLVADALAAVSGESLL
jgi:hypothetical protein